MKCVKAVNSQLIFLGLFAGGFALQAQFYMVDFPHAQMAFSIAMNAVVKLWWSEDHAKMAEKKK